jgi:hypothetical protein
VLFARGQTVTLGSVIGRSLKNFRLFYKYLLLNKQQIKNYLIFKLLSRKPAFSGLRQVQFLPFSDRLMPAGVSA